MSPVRRLGVAVLVVGLLLDLTSCSLHATRSASGPGTPAATVQPTALIGMWTMSGGGIEVGTRISFASDVTIYRRCGVSTGSWLGANDGTVLITVNQVPQACVDVAAGATAPAFVPRIADVAAVAGSVDAPRLVDGSGSTLAWLTRPSASTPPPAWGAASSNVVPYVPTSDLGRVHRASLTGTWLLDGAAQDESPVTFRADGSWSASQRCGTVGGRWALSSSTPSVLLVPDLNAQLECRDGPAVTPLVGGVTVGVDAIGHLVVADRSGHVTARYARTVTAPPD